jgi:hypothetical protein
MTPADRPQPPTTRVYLEVGKQSVFAVGLDWPGWARRATCSWAVRCAIRRAAFHAMDHAWEIEDKGS